MVTHLDEPGETTVAKALRRRGIEVTTTPEAGLLQTSDNQQLAFARAQDRVVFTQAADFLRMHAAGVSHAGIAYCHQQSVGFRNYT
jgi:predicted nuclease of predicted toxin-antitoxin system